MNTYGLLRQVIVPVLVINGDSDQSINPKVDPARVFAAVKGNPASKLVTVPLCSHDFKAVQDEADPGFLGEVVPDVTEALNEFLVPLIGGRIPDGQTQFHD
jgi:pimeloyl-ACP methyl ester carboxylesterase